MQMFLLNIKQNEFKSCLHSGMLMHGCSTASEPNRLLFAPFLCSWKIAHTLGCAFKIFNWMGHLGTQGSTCSAKNLQAQIEMNWKIYICYLVHLPVQRFCLGWSFMLLLYHYFWKKNAWSHTVLPELLSLLKQASEQRNSENLVFFSPTCITDERL